MRSSKPAEPMERTENSNTATADPQAEIERLQAELRREHDMYLRALADFENYRSRVDRDRAKSADSGKRDLIVPLLDVVDGFDRALAHATEVPTGTVAGELRRGYRFRGDLLRPAQVRVAR